MRPHLRTIDRKLARIATAQHGVVTRAQLLRAGCTGDEIRRRLRRGALIRQHKGVYRVGHRAPSVDARYLAAVLACGDGALLCGPAAGHLWRLLKGPPPRPEVLTVTERRVPGVVTHRARANGSNKGSEVRGIPATSVPRTLVDLASLLPLDDLARACHEAGVLYGTKPKHVAAVLSHRTNAPGAAKLQRIFTGDTHVTLSTLERSFLKLLRSRSLPLPLTNRVATARRVDCRWPEFALTVELDSYRFHNSRHAWEQDRRREREAYARGDAFRRYTYGDVLEEPALMLAELEALLAVRHPG